MQVATVYDLPTFFIHLNVKDTLAIELNPDCLKSYFRTQEEGLLLKGGKHLNQHVDIVKRCFQILKSSFIFEDLPSLQSLNHV